MLVRDKPKRRPASAAKTSESSDNKFGEMPRLAKNRVVVLTKPELSTIVRRRELRAIVTLYLIKTVNKSFSTDAQNRVTKSLAASWKRLFELYL